MQIFRTSLMIQFDCKAKSHQILTTCQYFAFKISPDPSREMFAVLSHTELSLENLFLSWMFVQHISQIIDWF